MFKIIDSWSSIQGELDQAFSMCDDRTKFDINPDPTANPLFAHKKRDRYCPPHETAQNCNFGWFWIWITSNVKVVCFTHHSKSLSTLTMLGKILLINVIHIFRVPESENVKHWDFKGYFITPQPYIVWITKMCIKSTHNIRYKKSMASFTIKLYYEYFEKY